MTNYHRQCRVVADQIYYATQRARICPAISASLAGVYVEGEMQVKMSNAGFLCTINCATQIFVHIYIGSAAAAVHFSGHTVFNLC